jgi:hypothetical protein
MYMTFRCGATYRPHIIVTERLEERPWRDALPVVHITLGRVVAKHSVDYNTDLAIIEPAFGTEPCLSRYCR